MKFYDSNGTEVDLQQFERDSIVIARATKEMTKDEWKQFCSCNGELTTIFGKKGIRLIFCPDWVEFKEWA